MHRLAGGTAGHRGDGPPPERSLLPRCANPRCATTWIRLWRNRRIPGFEGGWACSAECMESLVAGAVRREMEAGSGARRAPHRVPMGLLLVEEGRITPEQLRVALDAQQRAAERTGETMRLGEWLLQSGVLTEAALTRARSAQWNCPVFRLDSYHPEEVAAAIPGFLVEALGALPVGVAGGELLYVAFSERIDRCLCYALERTLGVRVAAGIAADSEFAAAQARFLAASAPRTRCLEAASPRVLVDVIAKLIESKKPVEARLARVHEYYWLRMWRGAPAPGLARAEALEDLLCIVGNEGG